MRRSAGSKDLLWRSGGDLNPRYPFGVHSLSRGAPSATRPPLQHGRSRTIDVVLLVSCPSGSGVSRDTAEEEGFEPSEAFTSTVFKTVAFNHSATPPFCAGEPAQAGAARAQGSALVRGRGGRSAMPVVKFEWPRAGPARAGAGDRVEQQGEPAAHRTRFVPALPTQRKGRGGVFCAAGCAVAAAAASPPSGLDLPHSWPRCTLLP